MQSHDRLYTADELCAVITSILHVVDNTERRRSEAELTAALQQPPNVGQLVTIICGGSDGAPSSATAGVRQMAAVLLRKRIFSLWRVLDAAQQQQLRDMLLQQLGSEATRGIRFALAHVVTRLAKADANRGGGGWPELQQAIRVAADDARVEMRELAMVLLYSFGEVFAEENALSGLAAESVVRGLGDSETVVQAAAARAAMVLLPALHEHPAVRRAFLAHLVPACLSVLRGGAAVEAKVPLCVSVLDLLEQVLSDLQVKKHGALVQEVAHAFMELLANAQHHPRVRESCGAALAQLATLKPKFVSTPALLEPLVQVCLGLMSEDDAIAMSAEGSGAMADEEEDASDDDEDADMLRITSPCVVGGRLLSALATAVPGKAFTAVLLPYIARVTDAPASVDARTRKATMIALASLAEGHASYLRRRVGYVLSVTAGFLQDAEPVPREAAAYALSYFCAHLQPEILLHHETLLPMVVPLLQDPHDLVRRRVAHALDTLCENLQENLDRYVPTLLPAVMAAIPISSLETQCRLCGVLSSMGMTHSAAFASRGPELLELLQQPFRLTTPETMALRAQATETIGVVGAAMGRVAFAAYLPYLMQEVVANLQTRNAAVREQSFGFLANMCELFREDYLPYLSDSIQCALEAIAEDRTVYTNKHLLADGGGGEALAAFAAWKEDGDGGAADKSDDDDDEDGGDEAEEVHMRVRTADVEEKSSAVYSVGVLADVMMDQLGEAQVAACWEALTGLDAHYYANIRANALIALTKLAKASAGISAAAMQESSRAAIITTSSAVAAGAAPTTHSNSGGGGDGGAFGVRDVLPPPVRDRVDELLAMLLRTIEEEDVEKDVVSAACESVTILMTYFGNQCAIDGPDAVLRDVVQLLRGTMPCQRDDEDDEDEDEDDDDDAAAAGMSYEEYQQQQQQQGTASMAGAAAGSRYRSGRDVFFSRADEVAEAHASAIVAAMAAHERAGVVAGAPPPSGPLPSAADVPPWYTLVAPDAVTRGVRLPEDHDDVVLDAAAEMLESVAKAYGALLQPYMPYLVPLLALHADVDARPPEGVVTGLGTLAAVLQAYGGVDGTGHAAATAASEQLLAPYAETALHLSFSVIAGSDESTAKANSAYLLRVLVEGCPSFFTQQPAVVPQCFQALWSIVGNEAEEIPEAVDNAVSATCSIVRCLPLSMVPVEQVIPALMAHLPMRVDKAENPNAVSTLCYLLATQHAASAAAVASWLPSVVGAAARILAASSVEEAERQRLAQQGVQVFALAHSQEWQRAVQQQLSSLSGEQRAALEVCRV
ncbi:HEAT-like repeat [Novymonas esmeraldas]|uniref:HEAT-like repeat n=1 Tax=Novymonas esmeraldas TaxID=1808958 RepID=A0AAW0F625_9TRYP